MVENAIHIKSEIKINVDASVRFEKTSSVWRILYLESCYM